MSLTTRCGVCIVGLLLPGCGAGPSGAEQNAAQDTPEAQQDALYTSPDCLSVMPNHSVWSTGYYHQPWHTYVDHGGQCRYEAILDVGGPKNGGRAEFIMDHLPGDEATCRRLKVVGQVWGWNGSNWVSMYTSPNPVWAWWNSWVGYCYAWFETPPLDTTGISNLRLVGHAENILFFNGVWVQFF